MPHSIKIQIKRYCAYYGAEVSLSAQNRQVLKEKLLSISFLSVW
jgi:hypothetical protein